MKTKVITTIMITMFLASMLFNMTSVKAQDPDPNAPLIASPPPGDNHFDVNFVTKGKIAFTSTFDGTTSPTVPPFYWHDDFETDLSKWSVISWSGSVIQLSTAQAHSGSKSVEVYQLTDTDGTDTILYKTFPTAIPGTAIFWFYDNTGVSGTQTVVGMMSLDGAFLLGIATGTSSNYYVYRVHPWVPFTATTIPRSTGWHKLEIVADGTSMKGYIDSALVYTTTSLTSFNEIRLQSAWWVSGPGLYFDDVTVLGPTAPTQNWVGDGPQYTETRTVSGPVTGPVISGTLVVTSTSTIDVTTGSGTTTGTWTLTGASGGFTGTLSATNTNFGQLSGTFVSTSATGIYAGQMVQGTFTGYFYESTPGISGYDKFTATLIGLPNPGEVLVHKLGDSIVNFQWGASFAILDSDAVFDGDPALVQLPGGPTMTGWYYEIFDQPRGKPDTSIQWFYLYYRETSKPIWYAHFGPARGSDMNFNFRLHWDTWYPALWPGWSTTVSNGGCTNLATRWYYYDTFATAAP